ncbi:transcriptional Adaptor 3 [Carabus blaptoides fortunei]
MVILADSCDSETNITFPYHRPADNSEILPCYTSVLSRSQDEGIGMKDLDQLQQELEKLLSASAVRSRILSSEFEHIDRVEERHEKKGKLFDKPPSPKHRKIEEKAKATKDTKPAYKLVKNFHDEIPKLEIPKVILPKNDTKSKFWLSVDPYCSPVSRDDIAFLDDLIQECNKDVELKIPEMGQHYVTEWAMDQNQEQSGGAVSTVAGKSKTNTGSPKENVNVSISQEKLKDMGIKPGTNGSVCLDKRLRNELVELGILDPDDDPKSAMQEEDEIVQEIKLCHAELLTMNEHNRRELNRLRNLVNKDITRQEFVQKLDEVDSKVMEMYNRLLSASPKERNNIEWDAVRIVQMQKELHKETTEITDFML